MADDKDSVMEVQVWNRWFMRRRKWRLGWV